MVMGSGEHKVISENRERIKLSGVSDVESFDDKGIIMQTSLGRLAIDGEGLHISVLNIQSGEVEVEGKINGIIYIDESAQRKKGLFAKGR